MIYDIYDIYWYIQMLYNIGGVFADGALSNAR